jgi:F420-non-reducing hydrogenase iron-sulfur subunit
MVPCTGRVEEIMILKAFENGADGVMVVGCLEGDCHYLVGNLRARKRVERVAALLEQTPLGAERVRMYNLSAGEGTKFAAFAREMFEHVQGLGPSAINVARGTTPASAPVPTVEKQPAAKSGESG